MIVNSHNDWDPLEEIIVGHAHHSRIATDISARSFSYANFPKEDVEKRTKYQWFGRLNREQILNANTTVTKHGAPSGFIHQPFH